MKPDTEAPNEQPTDTEILDWMQAHPIALTYPGDTLRGPDGSAEDYFVITGDSEHTDGSGPTLRAALADAMRKARQPGGSQP